MTWQAEVKSLMFANSIKNKDIAERLDFSEEWVSKLFNGKATSKTAEEKMRWAVDEIIKERSGKDAE